jgi:hypothetical protein
MASMDENKSSADDAELQHGECSPTEAANFPGSLVISQLEDVSRKAPVPLHKGKTAAWAHYFKDE